MTRNGLIAAAAATMVFAPALAFGVEPADRTITATDPDRWEPATVTITAGERVTFQYPEGSLGHNVAWEDEKPDTCDGNIPSGAQYGMKGWKGTCTFSRPGRYDFVCKVHEATMKGSVTVEAPAASPTPTASPAPSASPGPGTPQATPTPTPTPAATPKIRVASAQRGTRVRGTVNAAAGARVEVTVRRNGRRIGRSTPTKRTFSVALDARARRALKSGARLKLRVGVKVTPPGTTRTFGVTLRG